MWILSANWNPNSEISTGTGVGGPICIKDVFSVLHFSPLISANSFKIVLSLFRELNSNRVPVELSSANPSVFDVSKADSFLNRLSSSSAGRGSTAASAIGAGRYGLAINQSYAYLRKTNLLCIIQCTQYTCYSPRWSHIVCSNCPRTSAWKTWGTSCRKGRS
jgi:hypothetical protein